jgi:hypothetical protein
MNLTTVCGLWKKRPDPALAGLQREPAAMVILKSLIRANEVDVVFVRLVNNYMSLQLRIEALRQKIDKNELGVKTVVEQI